MNHAVFDDQRAAEECRGVDTVSARAKAIETEMTKNDISRRGGVDRDRVAAAEFHVSDVAGAAVDGDRGRNNERAEVAAGEAVYLGDAALADSTLECLASGSLAAGVGVVA